MGGLVDGTTGWRMDVIGGLVDSMVDLPFPRHSPEATLFVEKYEK